MGDFLIIPCLKCIKVAQKQAWRPLIYFAWMKSMYFREHVCRFSRKSHYLCILGVSHLKQDGQLSQRSVAINATTSFSPRKYWRTKLLNHEKLISQTLAYFSGAGRCPSDTEPTSLAKGNEVRLRRMHDRVCLFRDELKFVCLANRVIVWFSDWNISDTSSQAPWHKCTYISCNA